MRPQPCTEGETVTNHYGETRTKCADTGRYLDSQGQCIIHWIESDKHSTAGTDCDGYQL